MTMLRALSFDLDDTLWASLPVLQRAEQCFYDALCERVPEFVARVSKQELRDHRLGLLRAEPRLRHHISEWRRRSLTEMLRAHGYGARSEQISDEAFAVFIQARQQVELFAHVDTVLAQLSQRYTLVSLTNGNADFHQQDCSRYFHACLKAEDIGVSKPEPAAFAAALAAAGCAPEEMLHIGDHPRDDIEGAKEAGMLCLQACIVKGPETATPLADGVFSDWQQLPDLIEKLAGGR